jgi:hypothetical protein
MQRLRHHVSVFRTRRTRVSYGVLHDERYNKKKHSEQTPIRWNPCDGKKYAENRIDWLVRKGEDITEDEPIKRKYSRIVGRPNKSWYDDVVMSELAPDELPEFWDGRGGAQVICRIKSDLGSDPDTVGVTQKRKHLVGKKFLQVDYELLAFIEPEDLRFEIRVNGETRNEHQVLDVQWMFAQAN